MKVTIEGEPKEVAALIAELQERRLDTSLENAIIELSRSQSRITEIIDGYNSSSQGCLGQYHIGGTGGTSAKPESDTGKPIKKSCFSLDPKPETAMEVAALIQAKGHTVGDATEIMKLVIDIVQRSSFTVDAAQ